MQTLDIAEILKQLPHRYPFLLVDRILSCDPGVSIRGLKNVTFNEPFFQGHFPGRPVMPAVLLLEGMAQSAGAICALSLHRDRPPQSVYFITIDKAKFRRPVIPGNRVEYHMHRLARRRNMWWFRGEAKVDGKIACEAELGAMIAEP